MLDSLTLGNLRRYREATVDARAGVAGDMLLAALLDAGAPLDVVRRDVAAVLGDAVVITAHEVRRAGQRATLVDVELQRPDQPHRTWAVIERMLREADLPERVRAHALATFEALARAEAHVHGVAVADVHFHEVGAWDAIADVVGVCSALEALGVTLLATTDVTVGTGTVRGSHGLLPVPVPAVAELLTGAVIGLRALPVGAPEAEVGELATPTGVALLVALADAGGQHAPTMAQVAAVGVGAGHRELPDWPNVVRVLLGPAGAPPESAATRAGRAGRPGQGEDGLLVEWPTLLEANVDDLDPRAWPGVLAAVLEAGAVDAWLTPILMKKGRPAHTVCALVLASQESGPDETEDAVRRVLLTHTTTLGVRSQPGMRVSLPRSMRTVRVEIGGAAADVRVKVGHLNDEIVRATPEFEDCAALARAAGRPVAEVLAAAAAAAHAADLRPGATYVEGPAAAGSAS